MAIRDNSRSIVYYALDLILVMCGDVDRFRRLQMWYNIELVPLTPCLPTILKGIATCSHVCSRSADVYG